MESHDVDVRKRAIQQLVVALLAPYHPRLQPIELAWPSTSTSSHEQQLWLTLQHEPEPRVIISLTPHQLDSAVSPQDTQAYADLREYIWRKVQPLIH
jgi:hypothetical protein